MILEHGMGGVQRFERSVVEVGLHAPQQWQPLSQGGQVALQRRDRGLDLAAAAGCFECLLQVSETLGVRCT